MTKVSDHISSGHISCFIRPYFIGPFSSIFTISSIKDIENTHDLYRVRDCMKNFCKSLREHAMKIINFKKKEKKLLTNKLVRII